MPTNAAENTVSNYLPLPTTREERGRQIAKRGGIKTVGSRYAVPSESATASRYLVDIIEESCTCPDWELRRSPCKSLNSDILSLSTAPFCAQLCIFIKANTVDMDLKSGRVRTSSHGQNWHGLLRHTPVRKGCRPLGPGSHPFGLPSLDDLGKPR